MTRAAMATALATALALAAGAEAKSANTHPAFCLGSQNACYSTPRGLKCWGDNTGGILGLPVPDTVTYDFRGDEADEIGDNLPFITLPTEKPISLMTCGYKTHCAIFGELGTPDAEVRCWGGDMSEFINGVTLPSHMISDAAPIDFGNTEPIVDFTMGVGGRHLCVLFADGKVKCVGNNASGQLGLGDTDHRSNITPEQMGDNLPFVDLGTDFKAASLAAGDFHTCAVSTTGATKCWGDNYGAQLGQGDKAKRGDRPNTMGDNLPAINLRGDAALDVACGQWSTCVTVIDPSNSMRRIKCWGWSNQNGHGDASEDLGDTKAEMENMGYPLIPTQGSMKKVAGSLHWCVQYDFEGRFVSCWGVPGALGTGDNEPRVEASALRRLLFVDLGTKGIVEDIFVAGKRTCVMFKAESDAEAPTVKCFGSSERGTMLREGDEIIGDDPIEMGDNLQPLNLGNIAPLTDAPTASPSVSPMVTPTPPSPTPPSPTPPSPTPPSPTPPSPTPPSPTPTPPSPSPSEPTPSEPTPSPTTSNDSPVGETPSGSGTLAAALVVVAATIFATATN